MFSKPIGKLQKHFEYSKRKNTLQLDTTAVAHRLYHHKRLLLENSAMSSWTIEYEKIRFAAARKQQL